MCTLSVNDIQNANIVLKVFTRQRFKITKELLQKRQDKFVEQRLLIKWENEQIKNIYMN